MRTGKHAGDPFVQRLQVTDVMGRRALADRCGLPIGTAGDLFCQTPGGSQPSIGAFDAVRVFGVLTGIVQSKFVVQIEQHRGGFLAAVAERKTSKSNEALRRPRQKTSQAASSSSIRPCTAAATNRSGPSGSPS